MPDYLSMLRAKNVFNEGGFGVRPQTGGDPLAQAYSYADQLKNDDMNRQREMMRFQEQMRQQAAFADESRALMEQNRRTVFGPNKKRIVQQAPLTSTQQQFRQDELLQDQRKQQTALAAQRENAALERAMLTGKLNADRYAADRESREDIALGNRLAQNERSAADRKSREDIAETGRNQVFLTTGPDGQPMAVAVNPRENTAKNITIDGQNVGNLTRPGTPGKVNPTQQKGIDLASDALKEIDENLLNPDDSLTNQAQWATGGTAWTGWIPTTQGRAGQASLNRVASERILSVIEHMKNQSRTGATGMGNMSNDDRKVIESAATKLKDPWLDEETIRKELVKVRNILRKTVKLDNAVSMSNQPDPAAAAKLQKYGYSAGPNESASVYQPTRGALPITNSGTSPAPTLTPNAQESLQILQRRQQPVDTGIPRWEGGR